MAPAFVSLLLLAVSARALTLGAASHRELSRDTVVSLDTISFLANRHLGLRRHRHRRRQSVECVHKPESAPGPSPSQVPTSGSYEQPTSSSTSITHTSTTTSDLDHAATTTSTTHTHSATLTQAKPPPPQASPTSTKAAAPPANTVVSGGGGRTPFGSFFAGNNTGGDGTFYQPGLGACGKVNNENQMICAVPSQLFDSVPGYAGGNPNNNPICGKFITVCYIGHCIRLQIVDRCADCFNPQSVDMSITAFTQLAPESLGRIHGISWSWAS